MKTNTSRWDSNFYFHSFATITFEICFCPLVRRAIFLHFMLNMQIKKFTFFRRLAVFIFRNGISMQKNNILRRLYDTKKALCKARNWYLLRFFVLFVPSCLERREFLRQWQTPAFFGFEISEKKSQNSNSDNFLGEESLCLRRSSHLRSGAFECHKNISARRRRRFKNKIVNKRLFGMPFYMRFVIIVHSNDNEDRNDE